MIHLKLTFETGVEDEHQVLVCVEGPEGEKTLCGHETTSDLISGLVSVEKTKDKIDCHVCAAVIRHCHKIKLHEIASYELR